MLEVMRVEVQKVQVSRGKMGCKTLPLIGPLNPLGENRDHSEQLSGHCSAFSLLLTIESLQLHIRAFRFKLLMCIAIPDPNRATPTRDR